MRSGSSTQRKFYNLVSDTDRIFLCVDEPERMDELCKLNHEFGIAALELLADTGFQVTFAATEGSVYSPAILERYSHPYLEERRQVAREKGLVFYMHECGVMQNNIDNGFYARLAPDVHDEPRHPGWVRALLPRRLTARAR